MTLGPILKFKENDGKYPSFSCFVRRSFEFHIEYVKWWEVERSG